MPAALSEKFPQIADRFSRRDLLKTGMIGLGGCLLSSEFALPVVSAEVAKVAKHLTIQDIRRTAVRVPYREIPQRAMDRELPHWRYSEIFEVSLKSGHVGLGETLLYYTWGATTDEDVARASNKNAADLMWDDTLGAGLQMALFDAVAKAAEVPIHRLFGKQVYEKTPLSWWNIDMPADDMAAECKQALSDGYTAYKTKGRPWFDIWEQAEKVSKAVPDWFKLDMDFNDTLLDAERALPILADLEKYPQMDICESPIPQGDIPGNQAIRQASRLKIAMHYGNPRPITALKEEVCDGFVIGGGASRMMRRGTVAAMADKPFWIQLVGTGITAAYSLHFGAVLSHSTWPAVNCHQLYTHTLLTKPIQVVKGFSEVPQGPGLGYELDRDAVERFRVKKPAGRPEPRRLMEISWPDGRKMYVANNGRVNFMLTLGQKGLMPFFEHGVDTRAVPNDGSEAWMKLYTKARQAPVMKKG